LYLELEIPSNTYDSGDPMISLFPDSNPLFINDDVQQNQHPVINKNEELPIQTFEEETKRNIGKEIDKITVPSKKKIAKKKSIPREVKLAAAKSKKKLSLEKKERRLIKNRECAKESRRRKKEYIRTLESKIEDLKSELEYYRNNNEHEHAQKQELNCNGGKVGNSGFNQAVQNLMSDTQWYVLFSAEQNSGIFQG
jgi:hypothetical protein